MSEMISPLYAHMEQTGFTSRNPESRRKENVEVAALGIGTAGAVSHQAQQQVTKSYLRSMFSSVTEGSKVIRTNVGEATTLFGRYKQNVVRYTKYAMKQLSRFENSKYIAPLFKNKMVLGAASVFGTVMAFFALVTGVNKSIDNGKLMVGDIKDKLGLAA